MINIDKEKMNESINEAYNNQTEKVKKLLESAKKNLAEQRQCPYDYSINKEKANKFHTISRVVTKKKENENRIENNINSKFAEMSAKLDINSKNLDFIFNNVTENNKKTEIEIKNIIQENILNEQEKIANKVSEGQNKLEEIVLDYNSSMKNNILNGQKQVEEKMIKVQGELEKRINKLQEQNEQTLLQMKQEILQSYQKENKHDINTLLEERNSYLKELQEKDRKIRELNYKIYEYEEKLEKEIAKREKLSIFAQFFRKQEVQEEVEYTSQILNYVYQ